MAPLQLFSAPPWSTLRAWGSEEAPSSLSGTGQVAFCSCFLTVSFLSSRNADLFPGHVKVYNFRETVPRRFKLNLLNDCPSTFRMSTGDASVSSSCLMGSSNAAGGEKQTFLLWFQAASGSEFQENCEATRPFTCGMGNCPGPSSLSQRSSWPGTASRCPRSWPSS